MNFKILSTVFLTVALLLSGWMTYGAFSSSSIAGCGEGSGCGTVLSSSWSYLLGVPVSLLGILLYLFTLLMGRRPAAGSLGASLIIVGALYFMGIQAFVLGTFCKYCCLTHACASLAALFILAQHKNHLSKFLLPLSLAAVAVLALLQVQLSKMGRSETFSLASPTAQSLNAADQKSTDHRVEEHAGLIVPIQEGGEMRLGIEGKPSVISHTAYPILKIGDHTGAAMATQLALLFDYTCEHCLELLSHLEEQPSTGQPYSIYLLPASNAVEGAYVHTTMLSLYQSARPVYRHLHTALLHGDLSASQTDLHEAARLQYATLPVADPALVTDPATRLQDALAAEAGRVQVLLQIAQRQQDYNDAALEVATLPQLTAADRILTGAPTQSALSDFLAAATEAQKGTLVIKEELPKPRMADTSALKPTANSFIRVNPVASLPELATNQSQIEFTERTITTAPIDLGGSASGTFTFSNTGTEPLEILKVKVSCGCTQPQNWKQTLAPGETGEITVTFNSTGKKRHHSGFFRNTIWIGSTARGKTNPSLGHPVTLVVPIHPEKPEQPISEMQAESPKETSRKRCRSDSQDAPFHNPHCPQGSTFYLLPSHLFRSSFSQTGSSVLSCCVCSLLFRDGSIVGSIPSYTDHLSLMVTYVSYTDTSIIA